MRTALKRTGMVLAGAAVLTLGLDYAAMAATGKSLLLGKTNKSSKTTTLQNTKSGPALSLKTKSSSTAPLKVNGKGKVVNLNADTVDGVDSSALQRKLASCAPGKAVSTVAATGAVACGTLPRAAIWRPAAGAEFVNVTSVNLLTATYPAGTYLVSATTNLALSATATAIRCSINRLDDAGSNRIATQTTVLTGAGGNAGNTATGAVILTKPEKFSWGCTGIGGGYTLNELGTFVSVVPLDGGSTGVLAELG